MARGILMGTVSGLAFAAVVLGVASLLAPQPAGNRPPDAPATELAADAGTPPAADAAPGQATTGQAVTDGANVLPPVPPAVSAETGLPVADTAPAAVPQVARTDELAPAPVTGSAPAPRVAPDAPVALPGQGPAPQVPAADALALSTEPAVRPAPLAPALDTPPEGTEAPDIAPADGTAIPTGAPPPPAAVTPDATAGDAPAAPETAPAAPPQVTDAADMADAGAPAPDAGVATTPAPDSAVIPDAPPAGATEPATDAAPDTQVAIVRPDGAPLPQGDAGVRVNRPGDTADAPTAADDAAPADQVPALLRYAADFTDPGGLPSLSVVVIDDGSMAAGPTILTSIPFPVTVAIDPARPGAAEAMAAYRAAGVEVAALAALPDGAGATDVNVNLQAAFATLPETVALVDPGTGGLSADPGLAAAALARLADGGRGFVWMAGGLDQLSGLAADAGVPGVAMLRDLDGAGQDAATIRRFIDNAAFQARRDGAVVLLARLRPDTVSALTLWGTANRARQVTMAPLSAILNAI